MSASPVQTFTDGMVSQVTTAAPVAIGGLVAVGALAFGIKAVWVAWRAGSKAVGKTGT